MTDLGFWQVVITGPVEIEEWNSVLPEDEDDPTLIEAYYMEAEVLYEVLQDHLYNPWFIDTDELVITVTRRTEKEFEEWEASL